MGQDFLKVLGFLLESTVPVCSSGSFKLDGAVCGAASLRLDGSACGAGSLRLDGSACGAGLAKLDGSSCGDELSADITSPALFMLLPVWFVSSPFKCGVFATIVRQTNIVRIRLKSLLVNFIKMLKYF